MDTFQNIVTIEEQVCIVRDALINSESKVKMPNGIFIYLSQYKFKRTDGYPKATRLAQEIVKVLYEPVTKKATLIKKAVKKNTVKKQGKVVNGIRYIV